MRSYTTKQGARDRALLTGLLANNKKTDTFIAKGVKTTVADMIDVLKARAVNAEAVAATESAYHAAVQKQRAEVAATEALVQRLIDHLVNTLTDDELGRYGLAPPKQRVPPTLEERLVAKAKSLATRAASGPTAKQRKLAETKKELAQLVGNDDGAPAPASPPEPAKPNAA
jgi:hypothetical protein